MPTAKGKTEDVVKNPDADAAEADATKGKTDVEGEVQEPTQADLDAANPQTDAPAPDPGPALTGTGDLSKKGLVDGTTGKPVRYHKFANEFGVKVWAGSAEGEFRFAALKPDGSILRHVEGAPRMPSSGTPDAVNSVIELVEALKP